MKMPWPSSGKEESNSKENNKESKINESKSKENSLVLNFNGKRYDLDNVPKEIQELIPQLEIADSQLQLYQDTIELISLGRDRLISQINEKLKDIPSLTD